MGRYGEPATQGGQALRRPHWFWGGKVEGRGECCKRCKCLGAAPSMGVERCGEAPLLCAQSGLPRRGSQS